MKNITIAIADDHDFYRNAIRILLTTYGYDIPITVSDGKELIKELKRADRLPDICILDVNMPYKDGFETTLEIKQHWPGIKIIGLSVGQEKWKREAMLKNGADIFLNKNVAPKELDKALTRLCSSL